MRSSGIANTPRELDVRKWRDLEVTAFYSTDCRVPEARVARGAISMRIAHTAEVWLPVLAICFFAVLVYSLLAFAGIAPIPFACPVSTVRANNFEVI